jgi:hypothetical protein
MEPGKSWRERLRRLLDLVDTPRKYGEAGDFLRLGLDGRALEWSTTGPGSTLNADLLDGAHLSDIQLEIDVDITSHAADQDAHRPLFFTAPPAEDIEAGVLWVIEETT